MGAMSVRSPRTYRCRSAPPGSRTSTNQAGRHLAWRLTAVTSPPMLAVIHATTRASSPGAAAVSEVATTGSQSHRVRHWWNGSAKMGKPHSQGEPMEQLRTIGHLALHYGPGDQQGARRLLELCGCTLMDNGPSPGKDGFCSVLLDGTTASHAENLMFLSPVGQA